MADTTRAQQITTCAECGEVFAHRSRGSSRRLYCSRHCLDVAADMRRKSKRRAAAGLDAPWSCDTCGSEFIRTSRRHKFCSTHCKEAAENIRRVEARRADLALPDWKLCAECQLKFRPWQRAQTICGDVKCRNAASVRARQRECRGCGMLGAYAGRVNGHAGYCRTCRPVSRRSKLAIATLDQDWQAMIAELQRRSEVDPASGCWNWGGASTQQGYGCVQTVAYENGQTVNRQSMTHRVALEAKLRRPLGNLQAHHKCANRACCNPDHMEPVTSAQNMAEMLARASYLARIDDLEREVAELTAELEMLRARHPVPSVEPYP